MEIPQIKRPVLQPVPIQFDGIVAPSGGDWDVIQDGDDALDGNPYRMLVKSGVYPAGFTVATNNVFIMLGPKVVVQAPIILSGDNITLMMAPGCSLEGLLTVSGLNGHIRCYNAVDMVGALMSGNFGYINGGGWDTLLNGGVARHGLEMSGADVIAENLRAQTTAGGASAFDGVSLSGARLALVKVQVPESDDEGIAIEVGADDALVLGSIILGADDIGISVLAPRARLIGNYIIATGSHGIGIGATGDNSVSDANVVQDPGGNSVDIDALGEDNVVQANRLDGAVVDASGTSTVGNNDETAF